MRIGKSAQRFRGALIVIFTIAASSAAAEVLGLSFAGSNDSMGDWHDRWQSNSAQVAFATGPEWTGSLPERFGEVLEYRLRSDILSPQDLRTPLFSDRRHVGLFAAGLHSHAQKWGGDLRLGGDLFVIGPQTGLLQFQRNLHRILGFPIPTLDNFQIGNAVRAQVSAEYGRTWQIGGVAVRPFAEAQAGPEDLLRAGVDLTFGSVGADDLMTRLPATGHRVPLVRGSGRGFTFVLGADTAWVRESLYLPESLGHELTPLRNRVRAGLHYEHERFDLFYGLAWLGREFEAQPEGQLVGALHLGLRF